MVGFLCEDWGNGGIEGEAHAKAEVIVWICFKKVIKFKEKEKSACGVFDFHLTKPIFVGRDEGM